MNWYNLLGTAGVFGLSFTLAGFFVKKWFTDINTTIAELRKKMIDIDLTLAKLPSNYVTRSEFQEQVGHDKSSRQQLWVEIHGMKEKHTERITRTELEIEHLKGT